MAALEDEAAQDQQQQDQQEGQDDDQQQESGPGGMPQVGTRFSSQHFEPRNIRMKGGPVKCRSRQGQEVDQQQETGPGGAPQVGRWFPFPICTQVSSRSTLKALRVRQL